MGARLHTGDGKYPEIFAGGNFPESFIRCLRIAFYLLFYRIIYVPGYFHRIVYAFYTTTYVSGNLISGNFHY
jgi:hypothetical protein